MALSKDDILNAIADMSVMDIVSLIEAMEEKLRHCSSSCRRCAGRLRWRRRRCGRRAD
jgi:hypothetical protein